MDNFYNDMRNVPLGLAYGLTNLEDEYAQNEEMTEYEKEKAIAKRNPVLADDEKNVMEGVLTRNYK